MTYVTSVNTIEIDFADRISSTFQGLFADLKHAFVARRTARILNALSTRALDDLGVARNDIKNVATRAAFGL
jgi:uncharacterized protein YjiS (DUF1127 family)